MYGKPPPRAIAVSYTHLDVYKRQTTHRPIIRQPTPIIIEVSIIIIIITIIIRGIITRVTSTTVIIQIIPITGAVSYTHLVRSYKKC